MKTKVKLPVSMFSLDKVKPETVERWIQHYQKEDVAASDKLDGAALELVYTEGFPTGLYTRGNGIIGGDGRNIGNIRVSSHRACGVGVCHCDSFRGLKL